MRVSCALHLRRGRPLSVAGRRRHTLGINAHVVARRAARSVGSGGRRRRLLRRAQLSSEGALRRGPAVRSIESAADTSRLASVAVARQQRPPPVPPRVVGMRTTCSLTEIAGPPQVSLLAFFRQALGISRHPQTYRPSGQDSNRQHRHHHSHAIVHESARRTRGNQRASPNTIITLLDTCSNRS